MLVRVENQFLTLLPDSKTFRCNPKGLYNYTELDAIGHARLATPRLYHRHLDVGGRFYAGLDGSEVKGRTLRCS